MTAQRGLPERGGFPERRGFPERSGRPERGGFPARIAGAVQRAILGGLMSLAVAVLERRIRKALRRDKGQADEA
jgi:hypothetical protein